MFKRLIISPLLILFAAGCSLIKEDLADCGVLRLNLRFTYNIEYADRLTYHVGDIHFYVFDHATGVLAEIIEVLPEDIERGYTEVEGLPAGTYTFVAWGGGGEDVSQHFFHTHMDDPSDHSHSGTRIGETTLDDFYMMLDYDTLPTEVHGDITPKAETFDDLFHAAVEGVEVMQDENVTVDFNLVRNTNVLKVNITGLQHLASYNPTRAAADDQPLHVWAVGRNGRYRWDNSIDPDARLVRYEPPYTSLDETSMGVDLKTLRLDLERHADDPVILYVTDPATGQNLIAPLDVIDAIGQVKDENGNTLYATQEAIDREYEFPIDITILHDLSVKIFIADWEIVILTPEIDKP